MEQTGRLPYLEAYWQLVTYRTQAGGYCGQKHLPRISQRPTGGRRIPAGPASTPGNLPDCSMDRGMKT